jgi:C4-dicarboxylate transporter DctM subunit
MVVCIEIGGLTPPVGLLLYIACGVSHVPIRRVTRLVWYFVAVMVVVLLLLAYVPGLATWLPDTLLK